MTPVSYPKSKPARAETAETVKTKAPLCVRAVSVFVVDMNRSLQVAGSDRRCWEAIARELTNVTGDRLAGNRFDGREISMRLAFAPRPFARSTEIRILGGVLVQPLHGFERKLVQATAAMRYIFDDL